MEKRFKTGDELYLMVKVHDTEPTGGYDYTVEWKDVVDGMGCLASVGQAQLVSDADFGTSIDWQATYNEYSEKARRTIADLSKRITELNALLKNAQTRVDQLESALSMRNDANLELEKKNRELEESQSTKKGEVKHWRGMYMHMKERCNEYKRAADHLKEERDRADDELALTKIMNIALAEKIERMQNG